MRTWRKSQEFKQNFVSLFRLTRTKHRMFRWTEASNLCSNLSMAATCEHADSASASTHLQLRDGYENPGEPGKYSLDRPELMVLEDLGAGTTSLGALLLEMPTPAPCTTKSWNKPSAPSHSRGPAPATSALVEPYGAPPALGNSVADTTTGRRWATGTSKARLMPMAIPFKI
jgi:hypothetical protein